VSRLLRILLAFVPIVAALSSYGQTLALHDGDRVVFYGDSITAQRLYTRFVEDIFFTRYPGLHIQFFNAGVPGDTVYGGYTGDEPTRLKRDLFPLHPTVITVMLGMNDGYYMPFNPKYLDIYKKGYNELLVSLKSNEPSARVTLIAPTPYDEVTHGTEIEHYNEVVSRHAAFVKDLAASSHLGFSDFFQTVTSLSKKGVEKDHSLAALLVPDRIHPAEAAHWVMAAELARSWGVSPVVSRVSLDGSRAAVLETDNTQITALEMKDGGLHWTQADAALPLPLPLENEMMQFVLDISDLAAMDQQMLRLINLPKSQYTLRIDDKVIASFSKEQLAAGVNLALYATPMENQAKDVEGIELKRAQLDQANFILTIDDPKATSDAAATQAIEANGAALLEEQRKACQPHPHAFELIPQ
jgi:lysophospholipase L1-like esterase